MRLPLYLLALLSSFAVAAPSAPVQTVVPFLPAPLEKVQHIGQEGFSMEKGIAMGEDVARTSEGKALVRALTAAGVSVNMVPGKGELTLVMSRGENAEHYELNVSPCGVEIRVNDVLALPLVAQTLAQATVQDVEGKPAIPSLLIVDQPLFAHRGLMLDCGRYPQTVEEIKKILRVMARYKLNRFHWHLTEDQGWRLEIRAYPRLTQVGAYRPSSAIYPDNENQDGKPVEAFYTQDNVRDVVDYAHSLGIIVIPEIEIPGHASAAIAAYPELGNQDAPGFKPEVSTTWGVKHTVFAPREATFRFISTVLSEVCELFPRAPYIHCGGDEVPRRQWVESPTTREFMEFHGMSQPAEVQHWFTRFCAEELAKHGRRMVGWEEILESPELPGSCIVMAWRGLACAHKAALRGYDSIVSSNTHLYLNFGHDVWAKDPFYRSYGPHRNRDWQQLYSFNPIPEGLTSEQRSHVIGVQGNAWGEVIPDGRKLEYMVFPRLCALAEVAWLPADKRREAEFRPRLMAQYPYLDSEGINFREEDGTPRRDKGE